MTQYTLNTLPNQTIKISEEEHLYEISLRTFNDMLYASVSVDGEQVCYGVRCIPYGFLIPYRCGEKGGNFLFSAREDSYPSYKDYETTCFLYYMTKQEIADMREMQRLKRL